MRCLPCWISSLHLSQTVSCAGSHRISGCRWPLLYKALRIGLGIVSTLLHQTSSALVYCWVPRLRYAAHRPVREGGTEGGREGGSGCKGGTDEVVTRCLLACQDVPEHARRSCTYCLSLNRRIHPRISVLPIFDICLKV